jgi:hypothetical protein
LPCCMFNEPQLYDSFQPSYNKAKVSLETQRGCPGST